MSPAAEILRTRRNETTKIGENQPFRAVMMHQTCNIAAGRYTPGGRARPPMRAATAASRSSSAT